MAREWDASTYASLTLPHEEWGRRVLDRSGLTGTERVLDAGCGTGRDAAAALARWPGLDLVVLDGSAQMLDVARATLGDRVTYLHADLTGPLPLEQLGGPLDAVVSVATFHWIDDHDLLFAHLAAALRPGGRLTSDSGGPGNIATLNEAITAVTGVADDDWEFPGVADTRERLTRAGFDVDDVRRREHPFRIDDPAVLETYLATVCLGGYLADLPAAEHEGFVREVRRALPAPVVDYVRLEIDAVRR